MGAGAFALAPLPAPLPAPLAGAAFAAGALAAAALGAAFAAGALCPLVVESTARLPKRPAQGQMGLISVLNAAQVCS